MSRMERQSTDLSGAERFTATLNRQTEWLVMKLQGAFDKNRVIYFDSSMERRLNKKQARGVSVAVYLFAVTICAVVAGCYYALVWKPCPLTVFYRYPCKTPCNDTAAVKIKAPPVDDYCVVKPAQCDDRDNTTEKDDVIKQHKGG